jgi:hypothetical protein
MRSRRQTMGAGPQMTPNWEFIDISSYGMTHPQYICQIVRYEKPMRWDSRSSAIWCKSGAASAELLAHFSSLSRDTV